MLLQLEEGPTPAQVARLVGQIAAERERRRPRQAVSIVHCPWPAEPESVLAARRQRWLAAAMRRAYDMSWVPESVVATIRAVDVIDDAVVLTLSTGTRIVDRMNQITVEGLVDDVAVGELVEAVMRRGWDAVELHGTLEFRRAVARQLVALEPPVTIADNPLTEAEIAAARAPDGQLAAAQAFLDELAGRGGRRHDLMPPEVEST